MSFTPVVGSIQNNSPYPDNYYSCQPTGQPWPSLAAITESAFPSAYRSPGKSVFIQEGDKVVRYILDMSMQWQKESGSSDQLFDVTAYGAKPGGSIDCTNAFKACKAALVAKGGGVFYIPAGDWLVTDTISIDFACTIEGAGASNVYNDEWGAASPYGLTGFPDVPVKSTTRIFSTMANKPVFTLNHSNSMRGVEFIYVGTTTPVQGNTAVKVTFGYGWNWTSVVSMNYYKGFEVNGDVGEFLLLDCRAYGAYHSLLHLGNPIHFDYSDCNIVGCNFRAARRDCLYGIYISSGGGIKMTNVKINGSPTYANTPGPGTNHQVWVGDAVVIENNGDPAYAGGRAPTAEFTAVNCGFNSYLRSGFVAKGSEQFAVITIADCIFASGTASSHPAIDIGSNNPIGFIHDNYFAMGGGVPSGTPAIRLNAGYYKVHHNIINDYPIAVENNGGGTNQIDVNGSSGTGGDPNVVFDVAGRQFYAGIHAVNNRTFSAYFPAANDSTILDIVHDYYGKGRGDIRFADPLANNNYNKPKVYIGHSVASQELLNVDGTMYVADKADFNGDINAAITSGKTMVAGDYNATVLTNYGPRTNYKFFSNGSIGINGEVRQGTVDPAPGISYGIKAHSTAVANNLLIGKATIINGSSEPANPEAGSLVEWFDGTSKRWKKNVGGTITSGTY